MTATQTPTPAPRKSRRLLKIVGGALAVLFAIGLIGSCAKPAADTTAPVQATVAVATAVPTVRPTEAPKPTAVPATPAPAKPTQAPAPPTAPVKAAAATSAAVAATSGDCPADHPLKGNAGSKIFHRPGGASYARTNAEQCFDTAASAEAAGYRAAAR